MIFGTPLALALFVFAVPVVIFYILKVRLRRVPVSTNLFWKQIYDEKPPRSIWQTLRHLLSLLAQLLLVALLVLAVADPYFPWQLLQARRIVAVVDNSASMRATDVKDSRFDAAIRAALAAADGLRFRDEMAVVLAGPEPEVVLGMSSHVPTLRRALRSIGISDNPTQLGPAIELGKQLIAGHPYGQVIVFTDGCGNTADFVADRKQSRVEFIPPGSNEFDPTNMRAHRAETTDKDSTPVACRVFGTPDAGNVGITRFQVRRSLIDPLGYEVLVAVKNASGHAMKGRLELDLDGSPVDVLPLDLAPEGVFTRSLEKTSLEGGTLTASLTEIRIAADTGPQKPAAGESRREAEPEINALAADDRAWAVLPPREVQNVVLITQGNLFLQKVFEANPLVRLTVEKEFPQTWPAGGIIVLHRAVPDKLPAGNVFVVDPRNGCNAWELGEPIANPIVTEQDKESPLMTHVRLDNVVMPDARRLKFTKPPHVLAGALSGDPVYAEVRRVGGRCLVLSVNINEGDLAFRTAFPIMVANSLGWFTGQTGELRSSLATGSTTEIDLADHTAGESLILRSPSGDCRPLPVRNRGYSRQGEPTADAAYLAIPPLDACGVWSIARGSSGESGPIAELAVNLASDAESDLRTPAESIGPEPGTRLADWFTRPIWFYLAAAACLLTIIEWRLHQRRVLT